MLNENAKRWVAALRSGEYAQTTGRLHDEQGFCCLGVACDLYGPEKWGGAIWRGHEFEEQSYTLPNSVQEWLGLENGAGVYGDTDLAMQNDDGRTFAQIADIIESEPPGLFA